MSDSDEEDDITTDPSDYSDLDDSSFSTSNQDNFHPLYHNHNQLQHNESTIQMNHILQIEETKTKIENDPMHNESRANPSRHNEEEEINIKRNEFEEEGLDFLLAKAMTIYPQLRWNADDEWCRYCGSRASSSFFSSPWGKKQLCYAHYALYKQNKLDLSIFSEPQSIESVINPTQCTEKQYLIGILLRYQATSTNTLEIFEYKRRRSHNKRIKIEDVSDHSQDDEEYRCTESGTESSESWSSSNGISAPVASVMKQEANSIKTKRNRAILSSTNKRFECRDCNEIFFSVKEYKEHCADIHNNKKAFYCDECERSYTLKGNLDVHIRTQHVDKTPKQEETYKCDECNRSFTKKWYLRNHILNMHTPNKDKPFQCRFCTYGAAVKWSLDCHEALHLNKRQYKCRQCEKAFNVKQELQRHIANNHTKAYKCDECGKGFGSAKYLKTHIISAHTKNEHKPFQCKYCDYGAASAYIIKKHELTHSIETPFKCMQCNKSFRTDRYLQTHLTRVHCDDKFKPLQCEICGKRFLGKINLKNHYLCHEANSFHECDKCEYSTPDKKRFIKHKEIHSGEKPFECDLCHKRFRLRPYVLMHKQNVHKLHQKKMSKRKKKKKKRNIGK